jgi:hypothetical protein
MDYKQKYEQLLAEFEQYKKESIKWSVSDFSDWGLSENQAKWALEKMMSSHDASIGITWDTLHHWAIEAMLNVP